jgi:hypothetical protein
MFGLIDPTVRSSRNGGEDPYGDAMHELGGDRRFGVTEARFDPEFGARPDRLACGGVEPVGMLKREVTVLVPMHDQEGSWCNARRDFGRWLRRGIPASGGDPSTAGPPREFSSEAGTDGAVDPAHGWGSAVVPERRATDRYHRVDPSRFGAGLAHYDRGPHRETDGHNVGIAQIVGQDDGRSHVMHLKIAERGLSTGGAMTAHIHRDDTAVLA